ncbi:MAG: M20 family metallopeptidase [bacterium]|nr:M20 family metallopeptidase [bacterium]
MMPNTIQEMKQAIIQEVDRLKDRLIGLSQQIHAKPELAFEEFYAVEILTNYLTEQGFRIELNLAELPTAFRAVYQGLRSTPVIGLLAEYDALPEIGHGCGHNLIAVASVGAAVALKNVFHSLGLPGQIQVIGTPAEEKGGGKILLLQKGIFDSLDVAMMFHPDNKTIVDYYSLANQSITVEFFGKASHAAVAPEQGINALDALLLSFNNINALRQHIVSSSRIHGIITAGGKAANVVPDYASGVFIVRSLTNGYLKELVEKVLNCFRAASTATGAKLVYKLSPVSYAAMQSNQALARLFSQNLNLLGIEVQPSYPTNGLGSSDIGNVSQLVPTIHPKIAITDPPVSLHSPEFATAACSNRGWNGLLAAAKALAMTSVDLLLEPNTIVIIKQEFFRNR